MIISCIKKLSLKKVNYWHYIDLIIIQQQWFNYPSYKQVLYAKLENETGSLFSQLFHYTYFLLIILHNTKSKHFTNTFNNPIAKCKFVLSSFSPLIIFCLWLLKETIEQPKFQTNI